MRFTTYRQDGQIGLAVRTDAGLRGLRADQPAFPGILETLVDDAQRLRAAAQTLASGAPIDEARVELLPPLRRPPKLLCVGLNYADHTKESPYEQPSYPTIFARYASSLIGPTAPLVRPLVSERFDFEGELAVIIGQGGRHIAHAAALDHVAGYSVFNDASVRDYQMKSPQWTMGKNFDGTGAFGPEFVTADELPLGARGLMLETRLNGAVMQHASTADMLFDVATLIVTLSEVLTLEAGDVIVSGTPSGIGNARRPPIYMKDGDVCEVSIEGLGTLRNPVVDEVRSVLTRP